MYQNVVHSAGSNSGVIGPYGYRIDKVLAVRQAAEHRRLLDDAFFQLGIFVPPTTMCAAAIKLQLKIVKFC
jgi:hypothetical protein